jgi:HPt (histidine-containing phosphotransfer) domain-containing protein
MAFAERLLQLTDEKPSHEILPAASYLIDADGQKTLEDIIRENMHWQPLTKPNFGYTDAAVWLRVPLQNMLTHQQSWILSFNYPLLNSIDVWVLRNGSWTHHAIGTKHPATEGRPSPKELHVRIDMDASESTVLLIRARTDTSMDLTASLQDPVYFRETTAANDRWHYFYFGMMLVMIIYNAFLIQFVRNRIYLYYVLYVACYLLFSMFLSGDLQQMLKKLQLPIPKNLISLVLGSACIWFTLFSMNFLLLKKHGRKMYLYARMMLGLSYLTIVFTFVAPYRLALSLCFLIGLLSTAMPIFAIYCYRQGYAAARFYFLAFGLLLAGLVTTILHKFGMVPTNGLTINSIQISSALEIMLLALALGDKIYLEQKEARRINSELHRNLEREHAAVIQLNESLERRVLETTRDVRSLLDHIPQGVLSIEQDLSISKQYSAHLPVILENDEIGGQTFQKLLLERCTLTLDETDRIMQALQACLGDTMLAFDVNNAHLPRELTYQSPSGRTKILDLTWSADVDQKDCIERILVTTRDVTQSKQLEQEVLSQQHEMRTIKELIDCGEARFNQFVSTVKPLLLELERLTQYEALDIPTIKIMFVNAHTIKGSARTLGLKSLSAVVHQAERYYADILREGMAIEPSRMAQDIAHINDIFTHYLKIHDNTLNRGHTLDLVQIKKDILVEHCRLLLRLEEHRDPGAENAYRQTIRSSIDQLVALIHQSLAHILEDCFMQAERVAKDLGKPAPDIRLAVDDVFINRAVEEVLRKVSIHILRNALDHGIESPDERVKQGKPPQGCIEIRSCLTVDRLEIIISDDGRGLAIEKLRNRALANATIAARAPAQEIAETIFKSGISTADAVTDISGRGVGMDAVRRFVEEAGGAIAIMLKGPKDPYGNYQDFALSISFPSSEFFTLLDSEPFTRIERSIVA